MGAMPRSLLRFVIPAKAGIQLATCFSWTPASAGVTVVKMAQMPRSLLRGRSFQQGDFLALFFELLQNLGSRPG